MCDLGALADGGGPFSLLQRFSISAAEYTIVLRSEHGFTAPRAASLLICTLKLTLPASVNSKSLLAAHPTSSHTGSKLPTTWPPTATHCFGDGYPPSATSLCAPNSFRRCVSVDTSFGPPSGFGIGTGTLPRVRV